MKTELVRCVTLMRHGMRAPFGGLSRYMPQVRNPFLHGQLTRKGKALCLLMGRAAGTFFAEKELPVSDHRRVQIIANRSDRTIASARSFVKGMTGSSSMTISAGPREAVLFTPSVSRSDKAFASAVVQQAVCAAGVSSLVAATDALQNEFRLLEQLTASKLSDENTAPALILQTGYGPRLTGPLQTAAANADSLLCRHLLHPLLNRIGNEDLQALSRICDKRRCLLFGSELLVRDCLSPMLKELCTMLSDDSLSFALLCGHDSTLKAVLTVLKADISVQKKSCYGEIPPCSCLNFEVYRTEKNEYLVRLQFVCPTDDVMQNVPLQSGTRPRRHSVILRDLPVSEEGFYRLEDLLSLLTTENGSL